VHVVDVFEVGVVVMVVLIVEFVSIVLEEFRIGATDVLETFEAEEDEESELDIAVGLHDVEEFTVEDFEETDELVDAVRRITEVNNAVTMTGNEVADTVLDAVGFERIRPAPTAIIMIRITVAATITEDMASFFVLG